MLGKLQRRIVRAFIAEPGAKTTAELMVWCFPRGARKQCEQFSVRRAAIGVADRIGRRNPGGIIWQAKASQLLPNSQKADSLSD